MQATARMSSVVSSTLPARRRLIRDVSAMMIFISILGALLALLAIAAVRQRRRDQRVLLSLSTADREFIAGQLEPFTQLPLQTPEDEDIWDAGRDAAFTRIAERLPDFAREVLPRFLPYFNDADIFRREPEYRVARERYVIDFIHELRTEPTEP